MLKTFQEIISALKKFRDQRDWAQFHDSRRGMKGCYVRAEDEELLEYVKDVSQ